MSLLEDGGHLVFGVMGLGQPKDEICGELVAGEGDIEGRVGPRVSRMQFRCEKGQAVLPPDASFCAGRTAKGTLYHAAAFGPAFRMQVPPGKHEVLAWWAS